VVDLAFSRPTLTELVDRITSDMETRITGVGSLFRRSILKVLCKVFAGAIHLCYGYLFYMADQLFISTADDNYINVHATEYGLSASEGGKATGTGTVTGTTGYIIPADTKIQSADGYIYLIDSEVTLVLGTGTVTFTAEVIGDDYNDDGGIILNFISPISNIDSTITVNSTGIISGEDAETADEVREKILQRKRLPPHGGTLFDYEIWMKEVSGVTRAWAFDQYMGNGTVGCAFVCDNDASIYPTQTKRDEVEDYLISHSDPASGDTVGIPVGGSGGMTMIAMEEFSIDFTIKLYPNTSAVQTTVEAELTNLFLREAAPGETLHLSQISEAISAAAGEEYHEITTPSIHITADYNEVPLVGTVTFEDYV